MRASKGEELIFQFLEGFEPRLSEEEEIFSALREMNPNKTPGPDGITNKLLQSKWGTLKGDIMQMFEKFHASCHLERELNESLIVLIPKKNSPQSPTDQVRRFREAFRPEEHNEDNIQTLNRRTGHAVYVDAARDHATGDTGIGWILTSHMDIVILAGSFTAGPSASVEIAECRAILNALQRCLAFSDLTQVFSDAQVVIEAIQSSISSTPPDIDVGQTSDQTQDESLDPTTCSTRPTIRAADGDDAHSDNNIYITYHPIAKHCRDDSCADSVKCTNPGSGTGDFDSGCLIDSSTNRDNDRFD
ncbi:hypothetical protein Sjap_013353 [Stephania japonica]|uniref:RNase H type-1 domain-containing protein n=1 Tax=Stephania japonica TaxID=461633 RepID=A0AAP0J083_9MAGN